jgi:hypothetical protein
MLDFLSTKLPNLVRFQIWSVVRDSDELLQHKNGGQEPFGTTRLQQDFRAMLRLCSFLVKIHKNLDLM